MLVQRAEGPEELVGVDPGAVADGSGSSVLLPQRQGTRWQTNACGGPGTPGRRGGLQSVMAQEESSQLAAGMHDDAEAEQPTAPPPPVTDGMSAPSSDSRSLALSGLETTCLCCVSLPLCLVHRC